LTTDRPVLVFGGPYSNLQATEALFRRADVLGFASDHIICTGDLTAYCGSPRATIDLVATRGVPVVMGNCDEQLARDADDCGCGFEEGSACDRLSAAWYAYASAQVTDDQRAYLATLPRRFNLTIGGVSLAIVHGLPDQINAFVFEGTPQSVKAEALTRIDADGIIGGHSGLPFTEVIDGKLWHNAGVIGMPANDGTPRGWYSIVSPDGNGGVIVETHALDYDVAGAQAAMVAAGLPPDYRDALGTGLWPSLDVLPDRERTVMGTPLAPTRSTFTPAASVLRPAGATV
jgi:predicted phosphodiesterase